MIFEFRSGKSSLTGARSMNKLYGQDELTLPGKHKEIALEMQEIVQEMQKQSENPCLWITIAGMGSATREDFSYD